MKLTDLDAQFVGQYNADSKGYRRLRSVEGAQGILFQCPVCAQGCEAGEEDGRRFVRGAHYVLCWFTNPRNAIPVPNNAYPGPGRWAFAGDTVDALTLSPSVNLDVEPDPEKRVCTWHGWVKNGEAT